MHLFLPPFEYVIEKKFLKHNLKLFFFFVEMFSISFAAFYYGNLLIFAGFLLFFFIFPIFAHLIKQKKNVLEIEAAT